MLTIWKVIPLNHPGIFFGKAPVQTPQFARSCSGESGIGRSVQIAWRHRAQGWILKTSLGGALGSAEGPLKATQGSTPGSKLRVRKSRCGGGVPVPGWGERQT